MQTGMLFYLLAGMTIGGALAAMTLRNLVHAVLCLVVTFVGLAALYLQLDAQFVGLAQVLVYVGAVAILIVFVILLTRNDEQSPGVSLLSTSEWAGLFIGLIVFGCLAAAIRSSVVASPERAAQALTAPRMAAAARTAGKDPAATATVKALGLKLLGPTENYVLPLEALGLLLTAAMLGAAVIAMPDGKTKP